MNAELVIRRAEDADFDGIWEIFHAVHRQHGLVDLFIMHRSL